MPPPLSEPERLLCRRCRGKLEIPWRRGQRSGGATRLCRVCRRKPYETWTTHRLSDNDSAICSRCRSPLKQPYARYGKRVPGTSSIRVCRDCLHKRQREIRDELLNAYGHQCACCGEREREFLQLDHIYGGGLAHRRKVGGTVPMYADIKADGYPKDRYQLLCANCNLAKSRPGNHGYCPHELERTAAALPVPTPDLTPAFSS